MYALPRRVLAARVVFSWCVCRPLAVNKFLEKSRNILNSCRFETFSSRRVLFAAHVVVCLCPPPGRPAARPLSTFPGKSRKILGTEHRRRPDVLLLPEGGRVRCEGRATVLRRLRLQPERAHEVLHPSARQGTYTDSNKHEPPKTTGKVLPDAAAADFVAVFCLPSPFPFPFPVPFPVPPPGSRQVLLPAVRGGGEGQGVREPVHGVRQQRTGRPHPGVRPRPVLQLLPLLLPPAAPG